MTAAEQKKVFGGVVFGKRQFCYDEKHQRFGVSIKVAFGQDYDCQYYSVEEIGKLITAVKLGKKLGYADRIYIERA